MNQWIGYGKVLTEPILNETPINHKKVCNIILSTKNKQYGYTKVPCIIWGKTAENFVKYVTQGGLILVKKSRIQSREVKIASGFVYQAVDVVLEEIIYVKSGHKDENSKGELGLKDPITDTTIEIDDDPFAIANSITISDEDLNF